MKKHQIRLLAATVALCVLIVTARAQDNQKPAYLNPSLPPEQRAADLVHRMTLEEKASQLVNQARAIPRLNVPAYDWWSEALHGVINDGTTEFPEPVGLAATFDAPAIHKMAEAISTEGRIKHGMAVREHRANMFFQGLDFWAPNINIFRDPRWGRGQETYGEDPFLTAHMGVAFVTGMQGDDPKYYRTISTPKHYAVHSGPESTRHIADVAVSKHDEVDTYLPAFRATVTEAKAGSVMCAYNDVNGEPACASQFLLQDQLRGKWNFRGYVVSDCGAVVDIYRNHHFKPSQPAASAISLQRGMDNECVDGGFLVKDDSDYKAYVDAVKQGLLKESEVDTALVRLYTARMRLGMFDPDLDPYAKIDEKELDSQAHRELAHQIANESIVLLKNDDTLPLKTSGLKIAVVGPLADQTKVLLGNYNGKPTHTVSILEGLKKEFSGATVNYVAGTQFLGHDAAPVPTSALSVDGKPGVKVSFSKFDMSNINNPEAMKPVATRIEPTLDAAARPFPPEAASVHPLVIRYEGSITAPETGDYNLGMKASGFFRVQVDGKNVTSSFGGDPYDARLGTVHLEAGKPAVLKVDYSPNEEGKPAAQLVWSKVDLATKPEAVEAAKNADVVIAVLGITSELEGEEMQVSIPGFKGGDRTSIDLPKPEEDLLEAVASTGKPVILVLTNGSALAVNWANEHANAIIDAWYPGEEGGTAVAETLSGKNNPAGRLPVTFYKSVDQLPPFEDYAMKGRTYRYFTGTPLYPFGYGLSYTKFAYSDLSVSTPTVAAGEPVSADVTVSNSGSREGDEVVQLYLKFPSVSGAPNRALRGFQRVHLAAGASQKVHFDLKDRDLSMVTEAGEPVIAEGEYSVSVGGGQPDTSAQTLTKTFHINGTKSMPE
ncbi:glycoside hydrolase family 3 C-terminal domain-containing protein [Telmatobacter sp. DSM 110680]|uniref:Glycoside hydrolase family 3 C-terminal domain-containing protein n=1 Tax=Telmatobacter sp. DSM 110680 TaxID=3036704 RepID=A0AAU7DHH7_9BACT